METPSDWEDRLARWQNELELFEQLDGTPWVTLAKAEARSTRKIRYQLERLRAKAARALLRRSDELGRHADQLSSITDTGPGNTALASFSYTRDGNNQLTSTTPSGGGQG